MTGFLQRLAERATGTAHPLKRVAPTLFAPSLLEAPSLFEELQQPADAMAAAKGDVAPSMLGPAAAKSVQPGQSRTQGVSTNSAHRSEVASPDFDHAVDHAVTVGRQAAIENSGDTSVTQPASMVLATLMPHAPDAVHGPAIAAATRMGSPVQAHQETNVEQPGSLRQVPAGIVKVEPLLPLAQPAREPFRPTTSSSINSLGRTSASMVEETTEVHISIGRIEVTAVQEPAPAKPATSRRNAPMSLDDYLAKRHGSRS